jgi:DNA-binding MarR family transcriptional regulator
MEAMLATTLERGAHLVGRYLERSMGRLGITQAEAHVLAQVAAHGPLPIATLHRDFGRKRSTLTSVLDRLEQRRLVRRAVNPDDRRSFVIHLTARGARTAERVTGALAELEHELRATVPAHELDAVERVVAALAGLVAMR